MVIMVLLYILILSGVATFLVTQVLIPVLNNRPLFPVLRKEGKLQKSIVAVEQQLHEKAIEKELLEKKAKLESPQPPPSEER